MGTRGIPARYGGFETFAEELATRLVSRGHAVTVYGRRRWGEMCEQNSMYRGVRLRYAFTIMHKYLETPLHAFFSNFDLFRERYDAILLCNAANSPFAWMIRLLGIPLFINVDGIERERGKWNALGRLWYRLGEISSVIFATRVVGDADVISEYYEERYRCKTVTIPYGATVVRREAGKTLAEFGLSARGYLLYVSRLEPENNALGVIEAYRKLSTTHPLVIVGDAPYSDAYKTELRRAADERVIFTGYQFGEAYQELQSNCLLYIQATEVGGTHPALVESMGYGNCVIANGTPENIEVLGDGGLVYEKNNFTMLSQKISDALASSELRQSLGSRAAERVKARYSWEAVTSAYEELFLSRGKRT